VTAEKIRDKTKRPCWKQ